MMRPEFIPDDMYACTFCGLTNEGQPLVAAMTGAICIDCASQAIELLEAQAPELADVAPSYPVDLVNHPPHYTSHPSGIEVIEITEHMNFCMGNAVKYILRADLKGDVYTDLEKAVWYLQREIARRKQNEELDHQLDLLDELAEEIRDQDTAHPHIDRGE